MDVFQYRCELVAPRLSSAKERFAICSTNGLEPGAHFASPIVKLS
jgi:hypothetical protein